MKKTLKTFFLGLLLGILVAFPLGMNFGRGDPMLSNPFAQRDIKQRVKEGVKEKAGAMVESAKEKLHDATKPAREEPQQP